VMVLALFLLHRHSNTIVAMKTRGTSTEGTIVAINPPVLRRLFPERAAGSDVRDEDAFDKLVTAVLVASLVVLLVVLRVGAIVELDIDTDGMADVEDS
jgi:hypothetical protein